MPLASVGRQVQGEMQDRYGSAKGKAVFYAKENKDPKFARAMKGKSRSKRKMSKGRR